MRKFRQTFVVTVTPNEIESGETEKGHPYSSLKSATISHKGRPDVVRTVMAFGEASTTLADVLKPGVPVQLAVQHNGATMRIVGLPRVSAA